MTFKDWRGVNGPWNNEPDRIQFEAEGFTCLAKRNERAGFWCGYVGIPSNHPYHKKSYNDIDGLDVHGGLTYSSLCDNDPIKGICHIPKEGQPDELYWLGFDCGHCDDLAPWSLVNFPEHHHEVEHYWTLEEVKQECAKLARQLVIK